MEAETDPQATPTGTDRALVRRFFDDFDEAFSTFDGRVIADRYATPYLSCRSDGSAESFADREAIGRYFQGILDRHHQGGVRSCRHRDLDVVALGLHLLGAVTWELLDARRAAIVVWRESYVLIRRNGALAARVSVDHPPAPEGRT
jgi:hypothetical protein